MQVTTKEMGKLLITVTLEEIFSKDPPFGEQFKVAVDDTTLTDVEKLSYLRLYLIGEARQSLNGLALTAANYAKAKQQLKKEYGRR